MLPSSGTSCCVRTLFLKARINPASGTAASPTKSFVEESLLGVHFYNMNTILSSNPTGYYLLKATTRLFKTICRVGEVWVAGEKHCWIAWGIKRRLLGLSCGWRTLVTDQYTALKMPLKEFGGLWHGDEPHHFTPSELHHGETQQALHKVQKLAARQKCSQDPRLCASPSHCNRDNCSM